MMLQENKNQNYSKGVDCSIEEQVARDLEGYLNFFPNRTFALRNLSKETGLNEKTLRRLIKRENTPSNQTLFKLYFLFTQANSEKEVLESCPPIIRERLSEFELDTFEKITPKNYDFLEVIQSDPIIGEIYLMLATKKVDLSFILYHFGQYGSRSIERLVSLNLACQVDNGLYTLSKKQPYLNASLLKALGLRMTKSYMKADCAALEGNNFIGLYAEGLNAAGKKKWLEIDKRSFNEKVAVAKEKAYQGDESIFTFQVTDDFNKPTSELQ